MQAAPNDATQLLNPLLGGKRILLVVSAPSEARSVAAGILGSEAGDIPIAWHPIELNSRIDLLVSGVGKANAAGATAHCLLPDRHALVVSIGIGGSLPAPEGGFHHAVGDIVRCERSTFADEGVLLPDSGWATMADRHFGPRQGLTDEHSMDIRSDGTALDLLANPAQQLGSAATVSACSGTDQAAHTIANRTGCTVEAMEGAAVGLATLRVAPSIPFLELRVISNRTGADQGWDLPLALSQLRQVARTL